MENSSQSSSEGYPVTTIIPNPGDDMVGKVLFYIGLAIDFIGVVGNGLCMLVMLRKGMRSSPFAVCAFALAGSDMCVLINLFFYTVGVRWFNVILGTVQCKVFLFIFFFNMKFSSWALVHIAFERFAIVMWPLRCHLIVTRKRTILSLLVTAFILIGIDLHNLWTAELWHDVCFWKVEFLFSTYHDVYLWIDVFLFFPIPFVLITVFNGHVILTLYRRNRKAISSADHRRQRETIVILVGLSIAFITFVAPNSVYTLIMVIMDQQYDATSLPARIALFLQEINFGINFYLYCLTGTKVRREVRQLLTCGKKEADKQYCASINITKQDSVL